MATNHVSLAVPPPTNPDSIQPAPPSANPASIPVAVDLQHAAADPTDKVAPVPSVSRAPIHPISSTSSVESAPPLLSLVANQPMQTRYRADVSHVIPSTQMLFYTLSEMDTLMSATHRFVSSSPNWIPYVSQLYVSVLFYYAVLRAQRSAGKISPEQEQFLDIMERQYEARSLRVPGPLVPFFEALGATSGPTTRYGNVTYGIPSDLNVSQNTFYCPANRSYLLLPNVILILDQMIQVFTLPGNVVDATDYWYVSIFGAAAHNNEDTRALMLIPHARNNPTVSHNQVRAFIGQNTQWRPILPFDAAGNASQYTVGNNADTLSMLQFLGFYGVGANANVPYRWFSRISSTMQVYSAFFNNSVPLASISNVSTGAIYVTARFLGTAQNIASLTPNPVVVRPVYNNVGVPRYRNYPIAGCQAIYQHSVEKLDSTAEQLGALAQFNTDWSALTEAIRPARANIVFGPGFEHPVIRSSNAVDLTPLIGSNIASYYHNHNHLKVEQ
jgi:hypothetical protein